MISIQMALIGRYPRSACLRLAMANSAARTSAFMTSTLTMPGSRHYAMSH